MVIAGAGGLVLQMLDDILALDDKVVLWVNMPVEKPLLKKHFTIISTLLELEKELAIDNRFVIGVGNPANRKKIADYFLGLGGKLTSFISPAATVSQFAYINDGCVVLHGAIIEAGVTIGEGCLINAGAIITHECSLSAFVEIGPGAVLAGGAVVKSGSFIGSNATVLPRVEIGENVIVGASTLANKNIEDNTVVAGVPAKKIK